MHGIANNKWWYQNVAKVKYILITNAYIATSGASYTLYILCIYYSYNLTKLQLNLVKPFYHPNYGICKID